MHKTLEEQIKRFFGTADAVPEGIRDFVAAVDDAYADLAGARAAQDPPDLSEERYRALIELSSDVSTLVNAEGIIEYVSPSVQQVLGYSPEELIGKSVVALVHTDEVDGASDALARAFATDETMVRFRVRHTDGSYRNIEITTRLGRWNGRTLLTVNARDITDRLEIEERSRRNANLFASVFAATPAAMTIADAEAGVYISVNDAFLRLSGYSREEVIGRRPSQIGIWADPEQKAAFRELLENQGFVRDFEATFRMKDTGRWHALVSAETVDFGLRQCILTISHDITQRREAEQTIQYLAYHDSLTDLPNRTMFKARLKAAVEEGGGSGQQVAVMFLDVDRFKLINDTLGHAAGDALLKTIGDDLSAIVRSEDLVARIGGDEFTILLSSVDSIASVVDVAERILRAVRISRDILGNEIRPTVSIGISIFPSHGDDPEVLMANADIAMYKAKEQGRDCYEIFSAELTNDTRERLAVESELRRAIEQGEFMLHYQPIVGVQDGDLRSVEALIRWDHPKRGLVYPDNFIRVAEETGSILRIGHWVLQTACKQAAIWHEQGHDIPVAVNVSGYQLQHSNLVRIVESVLRQTGLPPHLLHLEITEGVALQDFERSVQVLRALRQLGVEMSIDDFGTGYSSLTYLKKLPVDAVKIDQSFVNDLASDSNDAAIAAAIIAMAHKLGLRVIAEGIETEEQLKFLRAHDCDEMQGFLRGHPVPAEELSELSGKPDIPRHLSRTG
ncbi:MAG TPA: EAL domain-containing protein [Dehalococcoidia bacterium]|nr:EAL domain-containing protein [Dehalococcoidia bacterium]